MWVKAELLRQSTVNLHTDSGKRYKTGLSGKHSLNVFFSSENVIHDKVMRRLVK